MFLRALFFLLSLTLTWVPLELYSQPKQVLIISYAETDKTYNLNEDGAKRAAMLPQYFSSISAQGFGPPDVIFGAQRSTSVPGSAVLETASPTSSSLKQPVHIHPASDIPGLVNKVMTNQLCDNKCVLIIWDFVKIPDLISAFGYISPSLPTPSCYALTYVLDTFPATSNMHAIVLNQSLLSGDDTCGGLTTPTPPTPDTITNYIPITIFNGTTSAIVNGVSQTIGANQIYIMIQTNNSTKVLTLAPDGSGHMLGTPVTPTTVNGNAASFYSSAYSYPLSSLPSGASGFYTFYVPANIDLPSSRIFFSLLNPINWLITPTTGHINSQDDNFDTADNNSYTLYDKIEFTITNASLPWWQLVMNSTAVDYYCLPLSFYINYIKSGVGTTSYTGISPTISRENVFSTYQSSLNSLTGSGAGTWSTLYTSYTPPTGTPIPLRIASANSGALKPSLTTSLFPTNYLSANPNSTCEWVPTIWYNSPSTFAYYQVGNPSSNTITLDLSNAGAGSGTAIGSVDSSGNFVFTFSSDSIWNGGSVTFQTPMTVAPFFSGAYTDFVNPTNNTPLYSIVAPANATAATAIWQIFSCAFSVGLIPPKSPIGTPSSPLTKTWLQSQYSNFFKSNPKVCDGPWFNFYSNVLHTNFSIAPYLHFYTAPFDDFLGIDGTITVDDITGANAGASVFVTIGDMTNSVIPTILSDNTMYNVTFALLPTTVQNVTFNGTAVPSTGGFVGNFSGSNMLISLQYTTGSYAGSPITTFTSQLSPSTATTTPMLPGGANLVVSGNNLTIYLGSAAP